MSCDPGSSGFQLTESYVLGQGGEELTQLDGGNNWQRTNVYGASNQLATYDTAGLHFQLTDPLGTRRMQTSDVGQPETDIQSLPFGNQLNVYPDPEAPATADDATPLHFTGKERDTESGNDYFGARYYASAMGRFMSPDPSQLFYADPTNPQSLNLYSYGQNNPLKNLDPTGLDCVYFNDSGTGVDTDANGNVTGIDHNSNSTECGANGGDWVNGTTSASQVQYNASNDTFNIQSSSTWQNYSTTAYAPGPGGGGTDSNGNPISCSGNCDTANGYSSSFRWPPGTFQLGLSGNVNIWGPLAVTGSLGVVVDTHGKVGGYVSGGGGASAGAGGALGVQVGASNGNGICSLGGPFGNVSATGGEGAGGTVDVFAGKGDGPGGVVAGGSVTIGLAGGASGSATVTDTKVVPFGGGKCQ